MVQERMKGITNVSPFNVSGMAGRYAVVMPCTT